MVNDMEHGQNEKERSRYSDHETWKNAVLNLSEKLMAKTLTECADHMVHLTSTPTEPLTMKQVWVLLPRHIPSRSVERPIQGVIEVLK